MSSFVFFYSGEVLGGERLTTGKGPRIKWMLKVTSPCPVQEALTVPFVYSGNMDITIRQVSLFHGCTLPIKFFTLSQNAFPIASPPHMTSGTNVLLLSDSLAILQASPEIPSSLRSSL